MNAHWLTETKPVEPASVCLDALFESEADFLSGPPPDPRTAEGRRALISEAFGTDLTDRDLPSDVLVGFTEILSNRTPDRFPTTAESILRSIKKPVHGHWPGLETLPEPDKERREVLASFLMSISSLLRMR